MNLRRSFERFCYQNRGKGIPNLMLYFVLGSAVVYLFTIITGNAFIYNALCFDKYAILHGQVWRLFTYAFLYRPVTIGGIGGPLLTLFALYCFYTFGRAAEMSMGTFKFNLYFLSGIILQDIFCMITGTYADIGPLKLSMFLVFATQSPNSHIHLYGIIPIKTWVWALINIGIIAYEVISLRALFPHNLFPLVSLVNFFLFFGGDIKNIFPISWQVKFGRLFKKKAPPKTGTIQFVPSASPKQKTPVNFNHKCTVCGRTDVSNPELEFRYCSRCNGYHCYCEDHISNHTHIE